MKRDFLNTSLRWLVFAAIGAAFLLVAYGANQGRQHMSNRVIDWLPAGFEETKDFNWFLAHFHEGSLLMISWDGCTVEDPRLKAIADELLAPNPDGSASYCWKVMTSGDVLRNLTSDPLDLSRPEAFDRMRGWILSQDNTQGCLIVFLSSEGYKAIHAAIDRIRSVTAEVTGLADGEYRIAGPSIDSVAIDDATHNSQRKLLPLFLAVCVFMLFILLKSWLAVFVIFTAAIFNEEMSAALIYFTGRNLDSISLLCASLLFVLTISGGLHLLNYYRDNMERNGKKGAVTSAMAKAALPCGLACLTTVLGLFSLTISQVIPIRNFGIFSTVALITGTCLFFVMIGSFVEQFPILSWRTPRPCTGLTQSKENSGESAEGKKTPKKSGSDFSIDGLWSWLPTIVCRHRRILTLINLVLLIFFAWNLPKLQTTVTFHGMFRPDAPVLQDYDYLENKIGGLVPVEVVLNIPKKSNAEATPLEMLGLLDVIEQSLWEVDGVESSLSALTFLPFLPDTQGSGLRAVGTRSAFNKVVEGRYDTLTEGCLYDGRQLPEDEQRSMEPAHRWRISLRVCAKSKIVYGPFLEKISETVHQTIQESQGQFGLTNVSSMITGSIPLVHKAQKQLLDDLTSSYLSAFLMILLTLIFLLRGAVAGTLAVIPNIFPSVLVFGAMALMRRPVDMGTMMTASVALGISVDGTIHFLTWYRQGLSQGQTQHEAVRFAYRECGTAMVQATIICGGGMLVFALSDFVPIAQFAWMIALLLLIALYGDLVLFPAILAGKWGRFLAPKDVRKKLYPSHLSFSVAPASNTPFPEGKRGMEWEKSNIGSIKADDKK